MKIFENNSIFYVKTLALYGVLLAILYYPSMQQEQNESNCKFALADDSVSSVADLCSSSGNELYNFGKHISLIKRSQVMEAEFHKSTKVFMNDKKKLEGMKQLLVEVKDEKGRFSNYLSDLYRVQNASLNNKHSRKVTWKKNKYLSQNVNLESVQRQRKAMRYHSEVLRHAIRTLKFMIGRIEKLSISESFSGSL